jgi:PKD repeat protein
VKLNGTGGFYQPTLSVVPQVGKINLGGSRTYNLSLSSLPNGLAGYNMSVSLSNPAVSEITGLALPAWAFLNSSSLLPGDSIWFGGLDLNRTIEPGATDIPLGTVTVRGDSLGSTVLVVQVLEMDADGGGVLTPMVIDGQLNVYEVLSANYQVNITSGNVPLTVMFTDMSTGNPGPSSWSWNFGDGWGSTQQNPVHTFTSGGSFTVTLAVANEYDEDTIVPSWNISVQWPVAPFPGYTNQPTDQDGDGLYEDINGNGRPDFDDVVAFYLNMQWVRDNTEVGIEPYDFNGNGRIDYDDVVLLYWEVLGA